MITITDGRATQDGRAVRWVAANSSGGPLKPELIILHDTAGRLDPFNSVEWFSSKKCTTSAHFVVERDGTITQMVRTDRRAWHAGKSCWNGRQLCNSFSIGIEIVNPGKLDEHGVAWFGLADGAWPLVQRRTPQHGDGWWLAYTPEQIEAVQQLCRAIVAEYPDCNDVTTHWAVSRGRKIDPNPLFPLDAVRAFAFGHDEPDTLDTPPAATPPPEREISHLGQSTTVQTAVVTGGTGAVSGAQIMASGVQRATQTGTGEFSIDAFLLGLAAQPEFWVGLAAIVISLTGAAYIISERARKFFAGRG